jgi:hypothetical protein
MARDRNWKLYASATAAAFFALIIGGLLYSIWDRYATLSAALGAAAGWWTGVVLAPYPEEEKKFQGWSKAFTGFLGGITVTKLDQAFNKLGDDKKSFVFQEVFLGRCGMAALAFLTVSVAVFVFRTYSDEE